MGLLCVVPTVGLKYKKQQKYVNRLENEIRKCVMIDMAEMMMMTECRSNRIHHCGLKLTISKNNIETFCSQYVFDTYIIRTQILIDPRS